MSDGHTLGLLGTLMDKRWVTENLTSSVELEDVLSKCSSLIYHRKKAGFSSSWRERDEGDRPASIHGAPSGQYVHTGVGTTYTFFTLPQI